MTIKRFSKLKNGMYRITFENQQVDIHEDLILQYNLLLKREVSDDLLLVLEKENRKYQVYNIALRELQKKLRSEKELRDILRKKEVEDVYIEKVLILLREQGYLNDSIYLESYIHDRILLSSDGPLKIQKDLLDRGFSASDILSKLESFDTSLEEERILKIVQKNMKQNRKSLSQFCLKMKQMLSRLGYHDTAIASILEGISFDEKSLMQKEYDKLYRRLSTKYSGKELEYQIRQRLFQKGFRI